MIPPVYRSIIFGLRCVALDDDFSFDRVFQTLQVLIRET